MDTRREKATWSVLSLAALIGLCLFATGALAQEESPVPQALQDRVVNLASNVSLRLNAAAGRMSDIIARLETRTATLKGSGIDTTAAEGKLREAKAKLTSLTITLTTTSSVQQAVSGDTPRESWRAIRENLLSVRDGLKETHGLLRETVALLKEASQSNQ